MSESEGLQRHVESISALHHDFVGRRLTAEQKALKLLRTDKRLGIAKEESHWDCFRSSGRDVSLGHWSAPVTPTFASGFSFEDDQDHHHAKKSILGKVKEKAKKWRHMLAKKKHGHDDDNLTPPWGVRLDEEDDEQDPEYHGAPMYESETAPETYREGTSRPRPAVQSPSAVEKSAVFQLHNANKESEMKQDSVANRSLLHNMPAHRNPVGENGTKKTLTETVTEMLAPAYTMVSEATQMMASKIQSPGTGYELGAKQVWDKGISVKEYLLHKLEPGEEDRALCQVITEAVSPTKAGEAQGEVGIAEKVKEAVSSLRGGEELHGTQIPVSTRQGPIPVSTTPHAHEAPPPISANLHAHVSPIPVPTNLHASESSNPVFTNLQAHGSSIPGSTNPSTEDVEIRGRRLQAYTT